MKKINDAFSAFGFSTFVYYIWPLLFWVLDKLFVKMINSGFLNIINLIIVTPILILIFSIWKTKKNGINILIPIIIAAMFVPAVMFKYNSTAAVYVIIYFAVSVFGILIGSGKIFKKAKTK